MSNVAEHPAYSVERVRRSLWHFAAGKTVGVAFGFGLLLVLVRALSTQDFGFYIASQAALEVVSQVSAFGLIAVAQRYLPELLARGEGRVLVRLVLVIVLARTLTICIVAALIYILVPAVAARFAFDAYVTASRLFLLVILFEGISRYFEVIFDSLLMQGAAQVSLVVRSALRLSAISVLFFAADSSSVQLEYWILADAAAGLVGTAYGILVLSRHMARVRLTSPGSNTPPEYRRYFRYALPTYIAATLYTASGPNVVKLIAARVLSVSELAAFGFAAALSAMFQRYLPMFLLIRMLRPLFVAARQREDFALRLPFMASLVFKLNVFALAPLVVVSGVAGTTLADVLTGGRYPETGMYLLAFTGLLFAQALRAVFSLTAQAMEHARAPLLGTLLGLTGLVVGLVLSARLGGIALCIGLVLSELLFAGPVCAALARAGVRIRIDWRGYAKLLCAAAVSALAGRYSLAWFEGLQFQALLFSGLAVGMVFLIVAYFLKPFSPEERLTLNRILKRNLFVW